MRHPLPPDRLVDTQRERSLSFGRPETRSSSRPVAERSPIAVGPGRAAGAAPPRSSPLRDQVNGYPIQLAKVQRPALRDETLERPRLLDWLRAKIHGRVVLVLADAGYGKTTLLADFSRRTRMRTLWYRLDDDDRDWVSFLHHLVAAGREHDPMFAPETAALLAEIGTSDPGREVVLDTFLRELPTLTVTGTVLVLDDFHLVDDAADVRHISRELLARAPERLTIVFASRRPPTVPLARLRAVGEVAELGTTELRFDASETAQLFTETYGRRLDADVLADLAVRTEGWIASLQLVQAALRDRTPSEIRRFVRSLNGADHEMYDYLAEEVVGELDDDLQRFLMETSLLQVVTPELAAVVSGRGAADVGGLTAAAERLTLLSRLSGGPRTHQRYHPLVREFLEARLQASDGADAVADLHRRVAGATAATDWRVAAHHYREAGDTGAVLKVVGDSIPTIMGNGQYALAEAFIGSIPADERPPGFDLILSRVEMQQGDYESAIAASQAVLDSGTTDPIQRDHALLNLVTMYFNYGDAERALQHARLLTTSTDTNLRSIAEVTIAILNARTAPDIERVNRRLRSMAREQKSDRAHHFAVTMSHLANNSMAQDRLQDALREIDDALEAFGRASGLMESATATMIKAHVLARLGQIQETRALIQSLMEQEVGLQTNEMYAEAADVLDSFAGRDAALAALDRVAHPSTLSTAERRILALTRTRFHVRRREFELAAEALEGFPHGQSTLVGQPAALEIARAYLLASSGDEDARGAVAMATEQAGSQGAHGMRRIGELLGAALAGPAALNEAILTIGSAYPWHLTYVADVIAPRLPSVSDQAHSVVAEAAMLHPDRWRHDLRVTLASDSPLANLPAAHLLEEIGDGSDIVRLRRLARSGRKTRDAANLGRSLSRRLAPRVRIEDQGRVGILIGDRDVSGTTVRRKVLALLCFLITRPEMSATRDQVLDALWPDLDPEIAINSLNQTLYFLRRVFEENYSDDLSPGYVHHDSDVIWLDPELVTSRSVDSRRLIHDLPARPSPDDVERLTVLYRGRFALDFEYEEWAGAYRDSLHAAYLEIVERSVLDDFTTGHYDRGIRIARRALDVDGSAEQIEVSLLRLYRVSGAHAAAAEQYAHYASFMREELGVEPPPLDAL
jgi:ATP/maltotriose-dependent transcriptional regulator MalT/DNA-binding SARP family transcriptional activator